MLSTDILTAPPPAIKRAIGPVEKIAITSREQWLSLRTGYVTASDIASICGVGRRSPLAVWAEKTGRVDGTEDSKILQRGRWLESAVFEALAETQPEWNIRRAKVFLAARDVRLGATPDGVAVVPGVDGLVAVQAKVVSRPIFRDKWLVDPDDDFGMIEVPLEYQLQTLTEAMLIGANLAYVAALVIDTYTADLKLIPVERHPDAEQKILERVAAFWSDLDNGREPDLMPEKDADTVKALYPKDDGEELDLTGDNHLLSLVNERELLGATIKENSDRKKIVETEMKSKIGSASSARIADGRRVTYKTQQRAGYTVEPTEFRALRVVKR